MTLVESETGPSADGAGSVRRYEKVYFGGEWVDTPIHDRSKLRPNDTVEGPAVVVRDDTTTVIEPGYRGDVDRFGNILIEEA